MNLDKDTLQQQLDRLTKDGAQIEATIQQRRREMQQLHEQAQQKQIEIERILGAQSYNTLLKDQVAADLTKLLASEKTSPAS